MSNIKNKEDQDPLSHKELLKKFKNRDALGKLDYSKVDPGLLIGVSGVSFNALVQKIVYNNESRNRLQVEYLLNELGVHRFSEKMKSMKIGEDDFIIDPNVGIRKTNHFIPDHLPFSNQPTNKAKMKRENKKYYGKFPGDKKRNYATTIFGNDDRVTYLDSSYPWNTVGIVQTAGGLASGVMVGPRHLLTVSHTIDWNNDDSAGWVRFTPATYDGSNPFGATTGSRVYYRRKVFGPELSKDELKHDYAVIVLNDRIGDLTGWLGCRGWRDRWDNTPYWTHIAYAGDTNSGTRPIFLRDIEMDGSFWDKKKHTRIHHQADVWPMQSGGPFFGWWDDGPYVVGVQSGENSEENTASGGSEMVDLVIRARLEHP